MANSKVVVTVNGVPVEKVIDEEVRAEYRTFHHQEIKGLAFVVAMSKHSTTRNSNHSGCRSGRGRVIYSAGGQA